MLLPLASAPSRRLLSSAKLDGERLLVELPAGASFQRTVVEGPKNAQLLGYVLHEATGRLLEVEFRDAAAPALVEDGQPASDLGEEAVPDEMLAPTQ